jgi:hypothetical protein
LLASLLALLFAALVLSAPDRPAPRGWLLQLFRRQIDALSAGEPPLNVVIPATA